MLGWVGCCCEGEGCAPVAVTVRQCGTSALVSGALVVARSGGGTVVGSGTTNAPGVASVAIPSAGTYTLEVSKFGEVTTTVPVALACGGATTVTLAKGIVFRVTECGCPAVGAVVTLTQTVGGSYTGSATTVWDEVAGHGQASFAVPIDNGQVYTYTITKSPHAVTTGTMTLSGLAFAACQYAFTRAMTVSPGYWCYPSAPCMDDVPATLTGTLSADTHRWGSLAGQSLTFARIGDNYSWMTGCEPITGGAVPRGYVRIQVSIFGSGCGATPTTLDLTGVRWHDAAGCSDAAFVSATLAYTSGTTACPVAFVATELIAFGAGPAGTITFSE